MSQSHGRFHARNHLALRVNSPAASLYSSPSSRNKTRNKTACHTRHETHISQTQQPKPPKPPSRGSIASDDIHDRLGLPRWRARPARPPQGPCRTAKTRGPPGGCGGQGPQPCARFGSRTRCPPCCFGRTCSRRLGGAQREGKRGGGGGERAV